MTWPLLSGVLIKNDNPNKSSSIYGALSCFSKKWQFWKVI